MVGYKPTEKIICNDADNTCPDLDSWYNGGVSVFGRCKKGAWKGIEQWDAGGACYTPDTCPFLKVKGD